MPALHKKLLLITLLPNIALADAVPADPCASLLAVLNRPTNANSVCVAKSWQSIIEMGTQYSKSYPNQGHEYNFPDAELRLGLPAGNELNVQLPNYIAAYPKDEAAVFGYTATVLGYKHQFEPQGPLVLGMESLFTLPSGDSNFGSEGLGITVNGLLNYNITQSTALALMLGYSSLTTAANVAEGKRYNSITQDVVLSWLATDNLQFYAEVYGETKTSAENDAGYNADAGIQYLITPDIEVDIEYGQRLSGQLGNFSHYYGMGGGIRF